MFSAIETIMFNAVIEVHSIFVEATNCMQHEDRRLVVRFFDKCTHEKKIIAVLSSWTNALKIRHQDKETAKTA